MVRRRQNYWRWLGVCSLVKSFCELRVSLSGFYIFEIYRTVKGQEINSTLGRCASQILEMNPGGWNGENSK